MIVQLICSNRLHSLVSKQAMQPVWAD